ncbi:hypothetical protein ACLX1H_007670 [Fusarium chlamydosporum]
MGLHGTPYYTEEYELDEEAKKQQAIEEARIQKVVEEERIKSAAEKARIQSAVEKARLKRKAIEANTTKQNTSKTTIVKGVTITRGIAKTVPSKGVITKGVINKGIPIKLTSTKEVIAKEAATKGAGKEPVTKEVVTREATAKVPPFTDTTITATTTQDTTSKHTITKKSTTKAPTTKDVIIKDATITATKARAARPNRDDRPVRPTSERTTTRNRQRAPKPSNPSQKISQKGSSPSKMFSPKSPSLPELPETVCSTDPRLADEEPTGEQLAEEYLYESLLLPELPDPPLVKKKPVEKRWLSREELPEEEPLAAEHYWRLEKETLPERAVKNITWLERMSKDERNEHIRKISGWSKEVPYSRKLYYNRENLRKDPILRKRFAALQQLRMIMGYSTTAAFKEEWMEELPFRLRKTNMRDVRFICVDTDNVRRLPEVLEGEYKRRVTSFHLGVAILDTRDMRDVVTRSMNLPNPADLIKTYQFAVQTKVPQPDNYIFGDTEPISLADLKKKFIEWQRDRTVVGVAYSARNDFIILRDFDVYLDHVYWLDLCQAQYLILQEPKAPMLSSLLDKLGIRYSKLHAPGNDAHFTMRALMG